MFFVNQNLTTQFISSDIIASLIGQLLFLLNQSNQSEIISINSKKFVANQSSTNHFFYFLSFKVRNKTRTLRQKCTNNRAALTMFNRVMLHRQRLQPLPTTTRSSRPRIPIRLPISITILTRTTTISKQLALHTTTIRQTTTRLLPIMFTRRIRTILILLNQRP